MVENKFEHTWLEDSNFRSMLFTGANFPGMHKHEHRAFKIRQKLDIHMSTEGEQIMKPN